MNRVLTGFRHYFLRVSFGLVLGLMSLVASPLLKAAQAQNDPLLVFAAASLKDVFEEAGKAYTAQSGVEVKFSFAASSALAKQIEAAAPADLYASADLKWMEYLDEKKLIRKDTRVNLLGNELVVIAPASSPLNALEFSEAAFTEALGDSRLATGDVTSVPVGIYAKAALQKLNLWNVVEPRLAQAENVRAALAFVARKEAALGIVYKTDALVEPAVKIIARIPEQNHEPIVYPLALTASTKNPAAEGFLAFLKSPAARAIFERAGFPVLVK